MSAEFSLKEEREAPDPDQALNDIKDRAVMLSIAGQYVCEGPILKMMGVSIERNLEVLRKHFEYLNRQFAGKHPEEIGVNKGLDRIAHIAQLLQKADSGIKNKCIQGELGKDLNEKVISLKNAIKALKGRLEGRTLSYTWTDGLWRVVGKLRVLVDLLVISSKVALRVSGLFVMACLIIFSILYLTMESEKDLLRKIDESRTNIASSQAILTRINEGLKQIQKNIEGMRERELNRQKELELMDLYVRAYSLAEEQEKAEVEIKIIEKGLEEKLKKLKEVMGKSFFEKLLRR